jgi:hypothetical protein
MKRLCCTMPKALGVADLIHIILGNAKGEINDVK